MGMRTVQPVHRIVLVVQVQPVIRRLLVVVSEDVVTTLVTLQKTVVCVRKIAVANQAKFVKVTVVWTRVQQIPVVTAPVIPQKVKTAQIANRTVLVSQETSVRVGLARKRNAVVTGPVMV